MARIPKNNRGIKIVDGKAVGAIVLERTIDAKPEGSWTGPQDGPPSWLRPVPPTDLAKRPPASPPVAKSGAEAERQRQRANSDRSVEHKVMGSARMVQPDNLSSGFFWGGASGKRAW